MGAVSTLLFRDVPRLNFAADYPLSLNRLTGTVNQEVIYHLAAVVGAEAKITLEIEIEVPGGVPDKDVRDVTEGCRTLKFQSHGFEEA